MRRRVETAHDGSHMSPDAYKDLAFPKVNPLSWYIIFVIGVPFSYLFHSILRGEPAGDNPWSATGLEWTTTSPPSGHRLSDGQLRRAGQSVTTSAVAEVEYGITSRLAANLGVPYVFARYTGAMPPPSLLPVDACGCWHSSRPS